MANAKLGNPTEEGRDNELGYSEELRATDTNSKSNKGRLDCAKERPSELLAKEGSEYNALDAKLVPELYKDSDPKAETVAEIGAETLMEDKMGPKLVKVEPTEEENRNKNPGAPRDEAMEIKKGAAIDVAGEVNSNNGYDNGAKKLAPTELNEPKEGDKMEDNT